MLRGPRFPGGRERTLSLDRSKVIRPPYRRWQTKTAAAGPLFWSVVDKN